MISRERIDAHMRAMVAAHGCLEAAAEALGARWGVSVQKGTLSKRLSGELAWGVLDVIGIEDALGRYPITRMMARRRQEMVIGDIVVAAQDVARETGEAVAALTGVALGASNAQRCRVMVELDEAIEALRKARCALALDADMDGGVA